MTYSYGLDSSAMASATSVVYNQKKETSAAVSRPEKIFVLANPQTGKTVDYNKPVLSSGNAEDIGVAFGFGSPLHRMAKKLFPEDKTGSKVDTYFVPVEEPEKASACAINLQASGTAKKNFNAYLKYKDQIFEAAADVAGKVATNAQADPALDPRGIKLNIFEKSLIPFTILKDEKPEDILKTLKNEIDETPDAPFSATILNGTPTPAKIKGNAAVTVGDLSALDYSLSIKVDDELITANIGEIDASTAEDVLTSVNAVLAGDAVLSATTASAATTTFTLVSSSTGSSSKLEILSPETGTNIFAALNIEGISVGEDGSGLLLQSKFKGSTSLFEFEIVDNNDKTLSASDYGIEFSQTQSSEPAGAADISDALANITQNSKATRIVSQFNDNETLDKLKDYAMNLRDGLIAQYVLCYTAQLFPESKSVPGTVDLTALVDTGNKRRDDSVNIIIYGDYGELRALEWLERNTLLRAGISNIPKLFEGGFEISDLCTCYHPVGYKKPLYKYDRDITLIGNSAGVLKDIFENAPWKSIIIGGEKDVTNNKNVKTVRQVKAAVNTGIKIMGEAGWIANYVEAQERTQVAINSANPDRFDVIPDWELTGVGRIYNIANFVSFNFGKSV